MVISKGKKELPPNPDLISLEDMDLPLKDGPKEDGAGERLRKIVRNHSPMGGKPATLQSVLAGHSKVGGRPATVESLLKLNRRIGTASH